MRNKITILLAVSLQGIAFAQAPKISYTTPQTYMAGTTITPLLSTNTGGAVTYGKVTIFAGKGYFADGIGTAAAFNNPAGIAVDASGNLYVADTDNYKIRKINSAGVVTTLAGGDNQGSEDGTGMAASFNNPSGVAVDASGNVYVADSGNNKIRKITPDGEVTTFAGDGSKGSADGIGTAASFNSPAEVAVDDLGNVYVADCNNNKIRKITSAGVVSTLAGSGKQSSTDGTATEAGFNHPTGVAVDASGSIFVADTNSRKIRKITSDGMVTTLAGNGTDGLTNGVGTAASFSSPYGVEVDSSGNIYVVDRGSYTIRKITSTGAVTTLAGNGFYGFADGTGTAARFYYPQGVTVDTSGNVYMADTSNDKIRKITSAGVVTTLAGSGDVGSVDGTGMAAGFYSPSGVAVDTSGNLYVADYNKIRKITSTGVVTTLAGSGNPGSADGTGAAASFRIISGVAVDASGNVYVADYYNYKIRKITSAGVVTTLAGSGSRGSADGTGAAATFYNPNGVAVDASGNVYVADSGSNKIRKITPKGEVTTFAGSGTSGSADDTGTAATFSYPRGVAVDASGNVYVADGSTKIRKITPMGVVTTLAGGGTEGSTDGMGTAASFSISYGVAADASGNVYVADSGNNKIRKITSTGMVSTLAGNGLYGFADGTGTAVGFNYPSGVALDAQGNVYVADSGNSKIREINTVGGYSTSPALPAGLTIDSSTGIINGTPTVVSSQTTYTITATNNSGSSTTTVALAVDAPLGVEDIAFKNMVVYPNPTKGEVNINNALVQKVIVYNNAGQLVKIVTNPQAANTTTVQLNNLPTGIYYMNIETENSHTVKQVIKQ